VWSVAPARWCPQNEGLGELQARNEKKAEMAAMTRDELIGILTDIVQASRARLSQARPGDGLKAADMLAKMRME
jgi:hypothetical protein